MAEKQFLASEIQKIAVEKLLDVFNEFETVANARLLLEHFFFLEPIDILKDTKVEVGEVRFTSFKKAIENILAGEPIQYVLGEAWFYQRLFKVTKDTLIPRGETEELINLITSEVTNKIASTVLDIGTGSGCIAITLSLEKPRWQVYGTDISAPAIDVARHNNTSLRGQAKFFKSNVLEANDALPPGFNAKFDVVVSNPPYVTQAEATQMHSKVLDWEPHTALFVPDNDPLLFYRSILKKYINHLKPGGWFFFEINEAFGRDMLALGELFSLEKQAIVKDIHGKDRFYKGRKQIY